MPPLLNPFGNVVQRQSAPTEGSEQQPNSFGEQMSQPMAGGQGIMGGQDIRQYLTPFLRLVSRQMDEEKKNKIEPYINEVQQLTDQTFPDLNLTSGGLRGGLGSLFGGGMGSPFGGGMNSLGGLRPPESGVQFGVQIPQVGASQGSEGAFQSLQNSSPFGTGSFFR